jgi:penicillin-binding protein 2
MPGPEPEILGTVPVAERHLAAVRAALEGVVNEPGGTGGRARVPGIRVAGKTGTAQVVGLEHTEDIEDHEITLRHRDHAWFAAFAPAEAPEIAVAVIVEHGGHGSSAAGPVAQKVLAAYFGEPVDQEIERIEAASGGARVARAAGGGDAGR